VSTIAQDALGDLLARNQAFWYRDSVAIPLFGLGVNITFPLATFGHAGHDGLLTPDMIRPEEHLADWDRTYAQAAARGEDLLVVATPFAGIPWMEAIAGCVVRVVPGSGSAWAEYPADRPIDPDHIRFEPNNPWLRRLIECAQVLHEHAAGRYPIGCPILRGVSDMIAALLGSHRMVLEFYDHPQLVHELADRCTEIWHAVAQALTEAKGVFQGGSCADRRRVWGHGTSLLYQDDAVALASPRFFREFFLPRTAEILRPFTNTMIHLHSGTLPIVAGDLCALPELRAIEVLLDPGGASLVDLLPAFDEILKHKALVICGEMTIDQINMLLGAVSPSGLCLQPKVDTDDDANILWSRLVANRQLATAG
jgi:hypothetical protein